MFLLSLIPLFQWLIPLNTPIRHDFIQVWQAFPGVRITGTAKCGFLVRLCLRFLVLVYQSLYFM